MSSEFSFLQESQKLCIVFMRDLVSHSYNIKLHHSFCNLIRKGLLTLAPLLIFALDMSWNKRPAKKCNKYDRNHQYGQKDCGFSSWFYRECHGGKIRINWRFLCLGCCFINQRFLTSSKRNHFIDTVLRRFFWIHQFWNLRCWFACLMRSSSVKFIKGKSPVNHWLSWRIEFFGM